MFLYKINSSANKPKEDLMLSAKSFIKIRNRIEPKTDPWGTPDNTGTVSEILSSKTTYWVGPGGPKESSLCMYDTIRELGFDPSLYRVKHTMLLTTDWCRPHLHLLQNPRAYFCNDINKMQMWATLLDLRRGSSY